MDTDDLSIAALLAAFILLCALFFALIYYEVQEWEEFKVAHKCKVVAKVKGEVFNTVGVDVKGNVSVGVGSTSDKVGWLCDDGVTYYR